MFSVEQIVKIRRVNFLYCNEGNSPVEFFAVLCNYPYSSYIVATVVLGVTDRCGCPKSISHVSLRI